MFLLDTLINRALAMAGQAAVSAQTIKLDAVTELQTNVRKLHPWRHDRHKAKKPRR